MEFHVRIDNKTAISLLIGVALISAIGITLAAAPDPGHSWGEVECVQCITGANIKDASVPDAKISGVSWGKITPSTIPAGLADGDQVGVVTEQDPTVASWAKRETCPCGTCWSIKTYGSTGSWCTSKCPIDSAPSSCSFWQSGYVCDYLCTPGGYRLLIERYTPPPVSGG